MLDALKNWLRTRVDRDGQASVLERGLPAEAPTSAPLATPRGRRDLLPGSPQDTLDASLAGKVLQGWLQNQLQTLVPLTLRIDKLGDEPTALLMRFAAAACLAGTEHDAEQRTAMVRWLRSIGAGERAIGEFTAALARDVPLSPLVQEIRTGRLEPQAYAMAVMATDQRQPVGRLFANYVAARLGLPADAVRSIDRRFRR